MRRSRFANRPTAFAASAALPDPVPQLNTTPLIDVMLVLLVMVIITVPIMTHKVPVNLPQNGPVNTPPKIFRLDLDPAGRLSWNGAPIAEAQLPAYLGEVRRAANGALELSASGSTRYENYDRVLATIKRSGITRLGFVGNDRFVAELDH